MPKSGAKPSSILLVPWWRNVCDVDVIPERAVMRTESFVSIWLLALFSVVKVNPSVAYDLRTSPEKNPVHKCSVSIFYSHCLSVLWLCG